MRLVKLVKLVGTMPAKMETIRPGGQASEISQTCGVIVSLRIDVTFTL